MMGEHYLQQRRTGHQAPQQLSAQTWNLDQHYISNFNLRSSFSFLRVACLDSTVGSFDWTTLTPCCVIFAVGHGEYGLVLSDIKSVIWLFIKIMRFQTINQKLHITAYVPYISLPYSMQARWTNSYCCGCCTIPPRASRSMLTTSFTSTLVSDAVNRE